MSFLVKQQHFEGPLDLLLTLIEKRKLFVNDIALARVTDDYIEHIKSLGQFPLADSATFILIASTLLLIKSKSLLPTLDLTTEEERGIDDLERRLKIYQEIKKGSVHVAKMFGEEIFMPSRDRAREPLFSPDDTMTIPALATVIANLIRNLPKKELLPKAIVQKVISLEDTIIRLTERVTKGLRMSFKEFSNMGKEENKEEKLNVIVSFLAMLELVKQGVIHVSQETADADIHMETKDVGVPNYA